MDTLFSEGMIEVIGLIKIHIIGCIL